MLLSNTFLLQKYFYYQDTKDNSYLQNNEKINKLFYNYIKEIGYDVQEYIKNFTDTD
jgi:hypothetical protein